MYVSLPFLAELRLVRWSEQVLTHILGFVQLRL